MPVTLLRITVRSPSHPTGLLLPLPSTYEQLLRILSSLCSPMPNPVLSLFVNRGLITSQTYYLLRDGDIVDALETSHPALAALPAPAFSHSGTPPPPGPVQPLSHSHSNSHSMAVPTRSRNSSPPTHSNWAPDTSPDSLMPALELVTSPASSRSSGVSPASGSPRSASIGAGDERKQMTSLAMDEGKQGGGGGGRQPRGRDEIVLTDEDGDAGQSLTRSQVPTKQQPLSGTKGQRQHSGGRHSRLSAGWHGYRAHLPCADTL